MSDEYAIQPRDPDRINLVQITDTHIQGQAGDRFDGLDTAGTLARVISVVNEFDPAADAVLVTGDLVHDPEPAAYERLMDLLERLEAPVFCLSGNHDDPDLVHTCMNRGSVRTAGSLALGPWRVLLLNTWKPESHGGRLPDGELRYLEEQLRSAGGTYILVAMHHPPVRVDSPWMDAMGLDNGNEFLSIIDSSTVVRAVIWGHIHQEFEQRRGDVLLLGAPSTCVQFTPRADRYIKDDRPPGFRQLSLGSDGSVQTEVVRIGKSEE